MEASLLLGLLIASAGGMLSGAFAYPMARIKQWEWENIWLAYAFFGFVLIPTGVVAATFPGFLSVYAESGRRILLVLLLGHLWGWGSTAFGLGVARLGMSLAFALILGIVTLVGTTVPLLLAKETLVRGIPFLAGLALLLIGIGLFGLAGHWREQEKGGAGGTHAQSAGYMTGVVICLISGVLSSAFNIGVPMAQPVQELAAARGAGAWATANIYWPALLFGGFLANFAYCAYLLVSNRTFPRFRTGGWKEWGGTLFMGTFWMSGVFLYGFAAFRLGGQGPVLGWPVYMSFTILTAYGLGVLAGEWEGVRGRSPRLMKVALATMIVALFIIARSG